MATATPAAADQTHRLTVTFTESAYRTLQDLARQKGKSLADTLRDAIAHEKWLQDVRDEGWHLLIERDGHVREIVRI